MEPRPENPQKKTTDIDQTYMDMEERSMDGYLKAWQKLVGSKDPHDKTEEIEQQINDSGSENQTDIQI